MRQTQRPEPPKRSRQNAASGLGWAALVMLLKDDAMFAADLSDGPFAADPPGATLEAGVADGPLTAQPPHFAARAKSCIFIFLVGGTSQGELFDPKPTLDRLTGHHLPDSFTKNETFFSIDPLQSLVMGSRFGFRRYGQCGMEMSELLPHIGSCSDDIALVRSLHTDQFDHGPAEILFSTGIDTPGRPSAGAWIAYGLGSESKNLPGYVVLMTGRAPVARSLTWGNGFLPARHAGVLFRDQGEAVLNLANPAGITEEMQRIRRDAIIRLNRRRYSETLDPEIENRIASYELAFRMQAAAPELIDLSVEKICT